MREPSERGIYLSSPDHLPQSYVFVSVFYSFLWLPETSKEKGGGRDERARQQDMAERKRARMRERERERPKRDNVRGKEMREPTLVIESRRREKKKEKKDQSKEGERERRENEEFTSSISMLIPLS